MVEHFLKSFPFCSLQGNDIDVEKPSNLPAGFLSHIHVAAGFNAFSWLLN